MNKNVTTLIGGSGFIGVELSKKLLAKGHIVRIVSRHPDKPFLNFQHPNLEYFINDMSDEVVLEKAIKGSKNVVYLIGLLFEKGKQTFQNMHVDAPKLSVQLSKKHDVKSFVFVSAIGADKNSPSKYAQTKAIGEDIVREEFDNAVIIRPSIVFGKYDNFFNQFNDMAKFSPVLPLIAGGNTKFQPVWVEDVADAIINALDKRGGTYELGGPDIVTFKQCLEKIAKFTSRKRMLINLPTVVANIQARLLSVLPKPLLTTDQIKLLKSDNVVSETALKGNKTIQNLGVEMPKSIDDIVPFYLD